MKNSWLLCGWCCLLLLWAHWISIWFSLALVLGLLWYYRSHYRIHPLFVLLLLLLQGRMLLLLREPETPMDTVLQIREIKAGYAIAHTQGQDVMVYGLKHANFNDIVQVKGTYAPVTSLHNFHRFYFPDWLKRRGIRYQIQAQSYQLLQEGSGVRHTLYAHVQGIADRKQRSWLNMLLYGIHEEDVSYFLTSSGLHIATLAACLQKLLLMICSSQCLCDCIAAFGAVRTCHRVLFLSDSHSAVSPCYAMLSQQESTGPAGYQYGSRSFAVSLYGMGAGVSSAIGLSHARTFQCQKAKQASHRLAAAYSDAISLFSVLQSSAAAAVSRFPLCLCVFVCGLSAECAMFLWCIVCVYNTACRPAGCASAVRDNAVLYSTAALALSMGEGSCVLYQLCTEKAAGCFVSSIFVCALFFVV